MLFFGSSFSHLACYINYFFSQNQVFFSKLKKVSFAKSKLGYIKLGKTAVLVIFMLIYVNLCNGELSPSPEGQFYAFGMKIVCLLM